MHKFIKALSLASIIAVASIGNSWAGVNLKLAHAAPTSDLQQDFSVFFKKEVEKRTNGDVTVTIFPQGQLGNDAAMIDGTRSGIIDIFMVGLNNLTGLMPQAGAFTLPFMFPERATAYKVLDGKVGTDIRMGMEKFGLIGLCFPENGYRNMTNNRGPIKEPADVAGLQMRVNGSKPLNNMFEALGANPQQIPVAELYTALETGVVDSQDHPIGVTLSFKFYEVQKYLSMTRHAYAPLAVAMNLAKYKSLTDAQQKIIMEVAKEATDMQRKLSIEKEDSMIAQLKSHGMKVNDDVDSAAFQEAVKPVWAAFIKENGDATIKAIQEASK